MFGFFWSFGMKKQAIWYLFFFKNDEDFFSSDLNT